MKSFKEYLEEEQSKLDKIYAKAPEAKKQISSIGKDVAAKVGGFYIDGGIKPKQRSKEKVEKEYDGDESKLKDVVRGTVAVDKKDYHAAKELLEPHSTQLKQHKGNSSPLGYSGVNSHIKTDAGIHGEIQVNTPEMIYAKEKPSDAKRMLGIKMYNDIKNMMGPAGKGHEYYEKWRSAEDGSPEKKQIEKACKKYYSKIRDKIK